MSRSSAFFAARKSAARAVSWVETQVNAVISSQRRSNPDSIGWIASSLSLLAMTALVCFNKTMSLKPVSRPTTDDLRSRFAAIAGAEHVIADPALMADYLSEPRRLYHGRARAIVLPGSTAEVAAIVALCSETATKIVPQGGNTGLVGGQTPSEAGDEIVLSLIRMNRLREVDVLSNTIIVDAGMTLKGVRAAADSAGRYFPLALNAAPACTIGGNLATNAGGSAAIAYGVARDLVLGLEVVLADGRVLDDLSKLKKNNTGYDLKNLFIGSEGTLGIITGAVLKLFPKPRATITALAGFRDPDQALQLLNLARERVDTELKTFELLPRIAFDFVLKHEAGISDPLPTPHRFYVLLEFTSQSSGLEERVKELLEAARTQAIIADARLAATPEARQEFWRIRLKIPDVQALEGGSIKHDVSVPIAAVPAFLRDVEKVVTARVPGARLVAFGHLGDGNIHCNVSQPIGADKAAFLAQWGEVNEIVHGIVAKYHGSISAEHGIGQLKRDLLPGVKDPVALDLMRTLKKTLDPKGILNPGKVL
jgi:FAD/FMN-containing dehydrogenase